MGHDALEVAVRQRLSHRLRLAVAPRTSSETRASNSSNTCPRGAISARHGFALRDGTPPASEIRPATSVASRRQSSASWEPTRSWPRRARGRRGSWRSPRPAPRPSRSTCRPAPRVSIPPKTLAWTSTSRGSPAPAGSPSWSVDAQLVVHVCRGAVTREGRHRQVELVPIVPEHRLHLLLDQIQAVSPPPSPNSLNAMCALLPDQEYAQRAGVRGRGSRP
jgi:hypothetical protein